MKNTVTYPKTITSNNQTLVISFDEKGKIVRVRTEYGTLIGEISNKWTLSESAWRIYFVDASYIWINGERAGFSGSYKSQSAKTMDTLKQNDELCKWFIGAGLLCVGFNNVVLAEKTPCEYENYETSLGWGGCMEEIY